jgi:xylan 1,4-beta-xylosidase
MFQHLTKATPTKANILVNTRKIVGKMPENWKSLAQGGEEKGVRMLENVIPQVSELKPRYIRIDHIYDFYDVVGRASNGRLTFDWSKLDQTVCDIYQSGAKPFFSLGYMPETMSSDGTLIGKPGSWDEWAELVQKTIEHYSGQSTEICSQPSSKLTDIYYEVWNEPDLESFGQWSLYGGDKDYKTLYYYSCLGASRTENTHHFNLGGPATTAIYQNWIKVFLDYISTNNLRLDFISWHHYSKNPDDYADDLIKLEDWLAQDKYTRFRFVPKIISEWGYDSDPNPISETSIGAAHTVMSIRNLVEQNLSMAFAFEIKDGPSPRWGILSYQGEKKPRYHALRFLNLLSEKRLQVHGEGTYVRALASYNSGKITATLVNFDSNNKNTELVPVTFINLSPGKYSLVIQYLDSEPTIISGLDITGNRWQRTILMPPNMVVALELIPENTP